MTRNERIRAICCRLELDGDVISGRNVKTIEDYVVVKFEVASSSSFQYIKTRNPINWWGSAKRDFTHSIATVIYNTCY